MISAPRRWVAAAAVVGLGWLASPGAVPIYDGVGQPDEPYRYVSAPPGYRKTAAATTAKATSLVKGGTNADGISLQTAEQAPQASLFVPPQALAGADGPIMVSLTPQAPKDQPAGSTVDGNVYVIALVHPAGPLTKTDQASISTLYLRATTADQPGPTMQYRSSPTEPWKAIKTSRGGQDIYVSSFPGPGEYALAFSGSGKGGGSRLPFLVAGVGVLLVLVVIVVRLRSREPASE